MKWLGDGFVYRPQIGGDLGERMNNAFLSVFGDGYERITILGSDSPDLPETIIDKALRFRKEYREIGPTSVYLCI